MGTLKVNGSVNIQDLLTLKSGTDAYTTPSIAFGTDVLIGYGSTIKNLGIYSSNKIYLRPNNGALGYSDGIELSTTQLIPTKNNTVALGDSTHKWSNIYATTFTGSLSGNASSASKWATARTLSLTGAITGSASWDGSGNTSLNTTLSYLSVDNEITTNEAGWFDIAVCEKGNENSVRGLTEFYIRASGGSYTPSCVKITFDLSWSCAVNSIKLEGSNSIVGGARLVNAGNGGYRIQVYFNSAYTGNVYRGYTLDRTFCFQRNEQWSWLSGALVWYTRSGVLGSCDHNRPGISVSNYLSQRGGYLCLDTDNYDNYALSLSGGTMSGHIIFPADKCIIQNQAATSNYTTPIMWLKGGSSQASYDPQIGQHNTGGDGSGAMVLLPYATNTEPWYGTVGLYLAKGTASYEGSTILTASNYGSWCAPASHSHSYLPLSGGTMSGSPVIKFPGSAGSIAASDPMAITYGRISAYGTLCINANTDNSGTEYVILTAGKGLSSSTADGLAIGSSTLTWQNNTILTAGNYTSYTVTKTGSGASGTWGINITGNAGYASSAGTVTYQSNVSWYAPGTGSTAGWYRIYQFGMSNASSPSAIIHLSRSYNSPENEGYVFAITVGYNGHVQITQLSGYTGGHLVTKIRVDYTNSGNAYVDFYMENQSYNNSFVFYGSGYGNFVTPYKVSSPSGSTYEFSTVTGFKCDRQTITTRYGSSLPSSGYTGEIYYKT